MSSAVGVSPDPNAAETATAAIADDEDGDLCPDCVAWREGELGDDRAVLPVANNAMYESLAEKLRSWEPLKAENLPPCKLCGYPIKPGQWITTDGAHHACVEQVKLR